MLQYYPVLDLPDQRSTCPASPCWCWLCLWVHCVCVSLHLSGLVWSIDLTKSVSLSCFFQFVYFDSFGLIWCVAVFPGEWGLPEFCPLNWHQPRGAYCWLCGGRFQRANWEDHRWVTEKSRSYFNICPLSLFYNWFLFFFIRSLSLLFHLPIVSFCNHFSDIITVFLSISLFSHFIDCGTVNYFVVNSFHWVISLPCHIIVSLCPFQIISLLLCAPPIQHWTQLDLNLPVPLLRTVWMHLMPSLWMSYILTWMVNDVKG